MIISVRQPMAHQWRRLVIAMIIVLIGIVDSHDATNSKLKATREFPPVASRIHWGSSEAHHLASNKSRALRSVDPLTEYSDKLSSVARIANGIYLVGGLIDGKIPMDAVIEELSNFGSAKVKDVLAIQKDKVDNVMQDLATASGKLDQSPGVKDSEKQAIFFSRLQQEYKKLGGFSTFQTPDSYFDAVDKFNTDPIDFSEFNSMPGAINDVFTTVDALNKSAQSTSMKKKNDLNNLKSYLDAVITLFGNTAQISSKIDSFANLNDITALRPLVVVTQLLAEQRKANVPGVLPSGGIEANLKYLSTLSANLKNVDADVHVLHKLIAARVHPASTRRSFTPAFPGGATDLKKLPDDIRDPSLGHTVGAGKNFARLSEGLKGLVAMSGKLGSLDAKLSPLSTPETLQALKLAADLQQSASGSSVSPSDVSSVFTALATCNVPLAVASATVEADTLVQDIEKLITTLAMMKSFSQRFNPSSDGTNDMKKLVGILSTLTQTPSNSEVDQVFKEYNSNLDTVQNVVTYLEEVGTFCKKFTNVNVKTTAQAIINNKKAIDNLKSHPQVSPVITGFDCISGMKEPLGDVVKAVKASQIILDFKPNDINNIKQAVETVTQTFSLIKELQSVTGTMKSAQTEDVKEMVAMKDAQKTSEVLGSAAASIHYMNALQQKKATVAALRTDGGAVFSTEVGKVIDTTQKAAIEKKWGDHPAFLSSLTKTLQDIDSFKPKATVGKDLRELAAPLVAAKSVQGVKTNIVEKSEAVGELLGVSRDPIAQKALSQSKDQLDELAALDLDFASHQQAYASAPASLNTLFDFLSGFLSSPIGGEGGKSGGSNGSGGSGGAGGADADGNMLTLVIIAILVIVVVACIIALVMAYCRLQAEKDKPWDLQVEAMDRYSFKYTVDAIFLHAGLLTSISYGLDDAPGLDAKYRPLCRHPLPMPMETRVKLKGNAWYHANMLKCRSAFGLNQLSFIGAQGPQDGSEPGKQDNRPTFWQMVFENKCEFIVKLCIDVEQRANENFTRVSCSTYFPEEGQEATYGQYTVKTVKMEPAKNNGEDVPGLLQRNLVVRCGGQSLNVTHLHYLEWPDQSTPSTPHSAVEILKMVNKSKKPVLVHCAAGLGRTMTLIGMQVVALDLQRDPKNFDLDRVAVQIRKVRHGGIQNMLQCYLMQVGAFKLVCDKHDEQTNGTDGAKYFQKHLDLFVQGKPKVMIAMAGQAKVMKNEKDKKKKEKEGDDANAGKGTDAADEKKAAGEERSGGGSDESAVN